MLFLQQELSKSSMQDCQRFFSRFLAWFNPGWQPQAQLGDGKAAKAA